MNNIYNLLFVSNSFKYAEEFKRIVQFNEIIDCKGIARGLHDFQIRMNNDIHIVLISDVLNDGTLQDLLSILEKYDVLVFGIITQKESEAVLDAYGISYVYEKEKMPSDIVSFLQESLQNYEPENLPEKSYKQTPQETVENFTSRFSENYQPNVPIQNNGDINRNPINNPTTTQKTPLMTGMQNSQNIQSSIPQSYNQPKRGVTTMGILKPKVVCFSSAKGGVGKSTIAIEVASCLAARGNEVEINMATRGANNGVNVVLVDLNCAFGTVASTLPCVSQLKSPPTLADWVIKIREKIMRGLSQEDKQNLQTQKNPQYAPYIYKMNRNALSFTKDEILSLLVKDEKTGLYVLPTMSSNYDVMNIEGEFIELIIEELSYHFDAVVLDTGNNFEQFTQAAFKMSDEIYIIVQPNSQVCVITKNLLRDSQTLGIDNSKFKLVINHPQTNKQSISTDVIENVLAIPLVGQISHDESLLLAHDTGQFFCVNNKKKAISREMVLLANQVLPLWNVMGKSKNTSLKQILFGK